MSNEAKPTAQQIKAVQAVLYQVTRLRTLNDHLSSIATLMNLDPRAQLTPTDIRVKAGSGPNWYIADTGQLDPDVVLAASLSGEVAAMMQQMARDLNSVNIPAADRHNLQTALTDGASVWTLRSQWWKDPTPAASSIATTIAEHVQTSALAASKVNAYYRSADQVLKF
jgi:hypothetical protein